MHIYVFVHRLGVIVISSQVIGSFLCYTANHLNYASHRLTELTMFSFEPSCCVFNIVQVWSLGKLASKPGARPGALRTTYN